MDISGISGNEIYCLSLKGLKPGEIVVGNSVYSLGVGGALSSFGKTLAGGEVEPVTNLISEGRHAAIARMDAEAKQHGAAGVTGVVADLKRLAGFTEFLAQGTSVRAGEGLPHGYFSTAASGIELYCHLDAGYVPIKFVLGNIAYALGIGRGITGSFRTLALGEVKEFSAMYNDIRHTALARLRTEAAGLGANAVVDVSVKFLPHGPGTVELLMTGTASNHARLMQGKIGQGEVVTSELTGEELWNLQKLGYAPKQLVMATSVYSLGLSAGIGALFKGLQRGELPEVTKLIYSARENCLDHVRKEAQSLGAERVIGNKLHIRELSPGLIEVFAIGTAIVPAPGMTPATETLIPQAVIIDRDSLEVPKNTFSPHPVVTAGEGGRPGQAQMSPVGCLIALVVVALMVIIPGCIAILAAVFGGKS